METWRFETGRGHTGKKWEVLGPWGAEPMALTACRWRVRSVLGEPVPDVWAQQPLGNPLFSKPYLGQKMGPEACITSRGGFWTHFLCGKHTELFKGEEEKAQKCNVSQSLGSEVVQGHQNYRVLFTAEWVIQKSALVIDTQVILTIRRIRASRATAQLHASKLGFSEEIWGLSPTDSKSKNAWNYVHKMIRSKGSCHQHTGITGIPNW